MTGRRKLCARSLLTAIAAIAAAAMLAAGFSATAQESPRRTALMVQIEGAIGPATTRLLEQAIDHAATRGDELLVLQLNTPGGLVASTREIIAAILASPVPIVGFVAPAGGHAASAGTYILMATHVAAMAPGTNIGAATPVSIGGPSPAAPPQPGKPADSDDEKDKPDDLGPADAMGAKITNDAAAYMRSLAELRGRNADWAERAVRQAATLTASQALAENVIEFVAEDVDDLLAQIDGAEIRIGGATRNLSTDSLTVERHEPDWLTNALGVLANPNVALMLMLIGVYGLIFEFATPGTIGPGVLGAISLVIGLYALNQLPLNYAGLALMLLGVGLMTAEALTPSFGVLGIGGIVAFLIGGAFLIDTDVPAFQLSWGALIGAAAVSGALLIATLGFVWRAARRPVATGAQSLIGAEAEILEWREDNGAGEGVAWAQGERWRCFSDAPLAPGTMVRIVAVDGITLRVAPR